MRSILLSLLFISGCLEPEFIDKRQCTAHETRQVQVCTSDARGGSALGALAGGILFGKHGAIAGSIVGGSGATSRCHTETETVCSKTEIVRVPNPDFKGEKK